VIDCQRPAFVAEFPDAKGELTKSATSPKSAA
jgi:hypothetical protein